MPSLEQMPEAVAANASDLLLLDQNGQSTSVTVAVLQAGLQPKQTLASGSLLGRTSPGPGQPEPVAIGSGVAFNAGVLVADTTVVAPLASPNFTGTPSAPTPQAGDSSTRIATTAFVQGKLATPVSLTGDIISTGQSSNGALLTSMPNILSPGSFASVTVNAKGQVTGGTTLPAGGSVEVQSNKGVSCGYAALDSTGKIPSAQLPASLASAAVVTVVGQSGAVTAGQIASALGLGSLATESSGAVSITGGNLDATAIGATTPAPGSFTNLIATTTASVPTVASTDNSSKAATTAFVKAQNYITASGAPVQSVAGRTGAITLSASDVAGVVSANSAGLTGTPTAPTASLNTNTSQLATTAFVLGQAASASPLANGTAAVGSATQFARQDHVHPIDSSRAAVVSPAFTGTPTAPTAASGDNSNTLATTAFVKAQSYITASNAPVQSVAGRSGAIALSVADISGSAPLASPAFTGFPTAPTQISSDNSTKLATTAYVQSQGFITSATAPITSVAGQIGAVNNLSAGTTTASGSSTSRSLAARAADRHNVLDFGADPTAAVDSSPAFASAQNAAQSAGGGVIYIPFGTYKLSSTVYSVDGVSFFLDPGVSLVGSGAILGLNDGPSGNDGLVVSKFMNAAQGEFGFYSSAFVGTTGSTSGYEKATIYARIRTGDSAGSANNNDSVAIQAIAETNVSGVSSRIWANDSIVSVVSGTDAYAIGHEISVQNNGAAQISIDQPNSKVGQTIFASGSYNSTLGLNVAQGGGTSKFQYAVAVRDNAVTSVGYAYSLLHNNGSAWIPTFYVDQAGNIGGQNITASGVLGVSGSAAISGNLIAAGNTSIFNIAMGGAGAGTTGAAIQSSYSLSGSGKALLSWNQSGGYGETDLIINRGAGSRGGLRIYDFANTSYTLTQLFDLDGSGNIIIPGNITSSGLISNNVNINIGNINSVSIGATTAAAAAFTTLAASSLASLGGGIADASYSSQTPINGFSITVPNGVSTLQLTPAAVLASGTVVMPSSPGNGQWLFVASTQTVSSVMFTAVSGQTILNTPTVLPSGVEIAFQYQTSGNRWICQSGNDSRVVNSGTAGALTFGTGADGTITITSGTTTLARDTHWTNCTISGTGAVNTNGWRLFISGTLDISAAQSGAIIANGVNGNNASGSTGAFPPGGIAMRTVGQSPSSGGSGGAGSASAGGIGSSGAANVYGNGGNGGGGGPGGASTNAGGTSGSGGSQTVQIPLNTPTTSFSPPGIGASIAAGLIGGGGGGGGGDGTNIGGGGGAGGSYGGMVALYARNIQRGTNANSSIIQAKGGNGGNGGNASGGNAAGGGGGGGGGGGCVYLITETLLGSGISNCLDASGGNGGAGGAGSGTGKGGTAGGGGSSGSIQVINLLTPSYSGSAWNASGTSGGATSTASGGVAGVGAVLKQSI